MKELYEEIPTEITIQIPEGMVIDEENSTFSKIKFKPKEKQYPKIYEDLSKISGYYIKDNGTIAHSHKDTKKGLNLFNNFGQATAALALAQLTQLLKAYNGDWDPDYENNERNFIIDIDGEKNFYITSYTNNPYLLTFKTEEVANLFLKNFEDLIKEASILLFGYTFKD